MKNDALIPAGNIVLAASFEEALKRAVPIEPAKPAEVEDLVSILWGELAPKSKTRVKKTKRELVRLKKKKAVKRGRKWTTKSRGAGATVMWMP